MDVRQVDIEQQKVGALVFNGLERCIPGSGLGDLKARVKEVLALQVAQRFAVIHHQDAGSEIRSPSIPA
jgi:hypothetical protein